MLDQPPQIILASTSPYRAQLLQRLGLAFERRAPEVDETPLQGESAAEYVQRLARAKALAMDVPGALVIGADQAAVLDGRILGKPGTPERAVEQLRAAAGRRVSFLTGICLHDGRSGVSRADVVAYHIRFRDLDEQTLRRYVERERPLDCAGSFKAEGLGITLFHRMKGDDPTALIGLPLIRLVDFLREAGLTVP